MYIVKVRAHMSNGTFVDKVYAAWCNWEEDAEDSAVSRAHKDFPLARSFSILFCDTLENYKKVI